MIHPTHLAHRVALGESPRSAAGLPLLTTSAPACGPLWRLFDGSRLDQPTLRQARALCVRCGLAPTCGGHR